MRLAVIFAVMLLIIPFAYASGHGSLIYATGVQVSVPVNATRAVITTPTAETPDTAPGLNAIPAPGSFDTKMQPIVSPDIGRAVVSVPVSRIPMPVISTAQIQNAAGGVSAFAGSANITRESLSCPSAAMQETTLPAQFFSEDKTDCQLKSNPEEVEEYLQELEAIVEDCKSRQNTNYDAASSVNQNLHIQIDQLKIAPEPDMTQIQPSRTICSISEPIEDISDLDSGSGLDDNTQYTKWLFNIAKDVKYYCGKIDNMVAEVADECRQLNEEVECEMDQGGLPSEGTKTAYHAKLNTAIDSIRYSYEQMSTFYYPSTLKTYDFGNFRLYFNNGTNIDCTLKMAEMPNAENIGAQAGNPVVHVVKNIFSFLFGWWK
jgi:hypothetical protein